MRETEKPKRLQCRHIFNDGNRCGAVCLRNEDFCYYHHSTRGRASRAQAQTNDTFELPLPEDRSAIQTSIGLVLQRLAAKQLDPRHAGLLLYGLQIASLNLPKEVHDPDRIPTAPVDEIILHPELGPIAPESELPPTYRTSREKYCDWKERELMEREAELDEREAQLRQREPAKPAQPATNRPITIPPSCFAPPDFKPTILPEIKAVAETRSRKSGAPFMPQSHRGMGGVCGCPISGSPIARCGQSRGSAIRTSQRSGAPSHTKRRVGGKERRREGEKDSSTYRSTSSSTSESSVFSSRYFTITGAATLSPHSAPLPFVTARDPGTTTAPSGITNGDSAVAL
jgi:hypothetical protein